MLGRAEGLASGHANKQPCVTCRFEWPARNWPPHPAEMAEDLLRPLPGARWPAVGGAMQFAKLIEEDGAWLLQPVNYVVRTHGRSPTFSLLLCSQISDALDLPQKAYLDFPQPRG